MRSHFALIADGDHLIRGLGPNHQGVGGMTVIARLLLREEGKTTEG